MLTNQCQRIQAGRHPLTCQACWDVTALPFLLRAQDTENRLTLMRERQGFGITDITQYAIPAQSQVLGAMHVCILCIVINVQGCVCTLPPRGERTGWKHSVRITGQQEESILWQMDDRSTGVGEGQDGRDTKPSTLTGCAISQGAKLSSPAKARPWQTERGC